DAVERLVDLRRDLDQAQRQDPAVAVVVSGEQVRLGVEGEAYDAAVGLRGHAGVLVAGRDADPDGVVEVAGESGEGGDEAARAAGDGAAARVVEIEGDGASVGEQDDGQVELGGHGFTLPRPLSGRTGQGA